MTGKHNEDPGRDFSVITDNLASTAVTTNGTVVESRIWYNPLGETYSSYGTMPTDKLFTGQPRETTNAIYDYGARMYDGKIGRMLQPDAIVDPYSPQSLNRYSYTLNNPTTYTDPTGNCIPDMTCNGAWKENGIDPRSRHLPPTGQPYPGPAPISASLVKCGSFDCPYALPGWNSGILVFYLIEAAIEFTQVGNIWDASMFAITCAGGGCDWTYAIGAAPVLTSGMVKGARAARVVSVAANQADLVPAGSIKIRLRDWEHVLERHTAGGLRTSGRSVFSEGTDVWGLVERASPVMPRPQGNGNLARTLDAGTVVGLDRNTGHPTSLYTVITRRDGTLLTTFPGRPGQR